MLHIRFKGDALLATAYNSVVSNGPDLFQETKQRKSRRHRHIDRFTRNAIARHRPKLVATAILMVVPNMSCFEQGISPTAEAFEGTKFGLDED